MVAGEEAEVSGEVASASHHRYRRHYKARPKNNYLKKYRYQPVHMLQERILE